MLFNSRMLIVCTAVFMAAALMPVTGAVSVPETPSPPSAREVLADLQGCTRADANGGAIVIGGPAAGFGLGWTNPCVIIPNGGTVVWHQVDGIPHGARSDATCFDLGTMSAIGGTPASSSRSSTSLQLEFVPEDGFTYTIENGDGFGACSDIAQEGNALILPYHCIIHGDRMPGTIVIEL